MYLWLNFLSAHIVFLRDCCPKWRENWLKNIRNFLLALLRSLQTVLNGLKHVKNQKKYPMTLPRHNKSTFKIKMSRITRNFVSFHFIQKLFSIGMSLELSFVKIMLPPEFGNWVSIFKKSFGRGYFYWCSSRCQIGGF